MMMMIHISRKLRVSVTTEFNKLRFIFVDIPDALKCLSDGILSITGSSKVKLNFMSDNRLGISLLIPYIPKFHLSYIKYRKCFTELVQ